jgi:AcrR family transcriptional regulator
MSGIERRKAIIAAAREVFIEQGYSGARTKEIADRSGVTEAFLYRHLSSKDEMYEVAILEPLREGLAALAFDVETLHAEHQDPIEFMRALNERTLRFYTQFAVIQSVALYSELASGREFYEKIRPMLDRIGVLIAERMGWADEGLDPVLVRRTIMGAQWSVGLDLMLRGRRVDLTDTAQRLNRLFTGGIREKPVRARS